MPCFSAIYEAGIKGGRPSITPEKLMRAMLLQCCTAFAASGSWHEQIPYNLLFRWFVGLSIEDAVWNHSVFSKNRHRLIEFDAVTDLFNATVETTHKCGLLSGEHFSVDGALIHSWTSHKSIRLKDGRHDDGRLTIGVANRAVMKRTNRRATERAGSIGRAMQRQPCRVTWAMCRPITGTVWL
ncbi:transposase [Burkholderia cepacia]|uniref:transposase n=1 Tax=Burkholderia cepacia TaxID=292 RepID=UPI003B554EBF